VKRLSPIRLLALVSVLLPGMLVIDAVMPNVADAADPTTTRLSPPPAGFDSEPVEDFYAKTSISSTFTAMTRAYHNQWDQVVLRQQLGTGQPNLLNVSRGPGNTASNGPSMSLDISADGRWVLFASAASNLVADDTNGRWDLFVWDRQLAGDWSNPNRIRRVSLAHDGAQTTVDIRNGSISDDGTRVVFSSTATNLTPDDTNGLVDVFLRDLVAGTTSRISVTSAGAQAVGGPSIAPAISGDGNVVAFASTATNLGGNSAPYHGIYVHRLVDGTTEFISDSHDGDEVDDSSYSPALSRDGRFVAFESDATNLVPDDGNFSTDVFVVDTTAASLVRVSLNDDGEEGDDDSYSASISADGRFVAFDSSAENLVGDHSVGGEDSNGSIDVFVRDRLGLMTERVSLNRFHVEADWSDVENGHISPDGRYVVFETDQDYWQPVNDEWDNYKVFQRDRGRWLPGAPTGVAATGGNASAVVSWEPPLSDGNSSLTGYTVTASPGGQTCSRSSPPLFCLVSGLTNGVSYTFTVTATNAVGTGPPSEPSAPVVAGSVPGAPTAVVAVPADSSAIVSWEPPVSDGGSPVTGYTVTASPGGQTCGWASGPLTCTVLGLTNGVSYTFTVTATSAVGTGPPSAPSAAIVPSADPQPTGLLATPYLVGEVKAHSDSTKFQVWVENLTTERAVVDIHDVVVSATVNGEPVDPAEFAVVKEVIRNIKPGYIGKFGFVWNHGRGNLRGGDEIVITGCLDGESNGIDAGDCGSISRPGGPIDLAADASRVRDISVKHLSTNLKVSLYNVGEIAVPLDYTDVAVMIEVNGQPAAVQPVKAKPIDKLTFLPKMKMVKPPVFRFDEWRYRALHVGLEWDHGQLELGDEVKVTACSTVPGDVDSTAPAPPLFQPTEANNCVSATGNVVL
jgi:Tol biopolymer transport system component